MIPIPMHIGIVIPTTWKSELNPCIDFTDVTNCLVTIYSSILNSGIIVLFQSHWIALHCSFPSAAALWFNTASKYRSILLSWATLLRFFNSSLVPHLVLVVPFWLNSPKSHKSIVNAIHLKNNYRRFHIPCLGCFDPCKLEGSTLLWFQYAIVPGCLWRDGENVFRREQRTIRRLASL